MSTFSLNVYLTLDALTCRHPDVHLPLALVIFVSLLSTLVYVSLRLPTIFSCRTHRLSECVKQGLGECVCVCVCVGHPVKQHLECEWRRIPTHHSRGIKKKRGKMRRIDGWNTHTYQTQQSDRDAYKVYSKPVWVLRVGGGGGGGGGIKALVNGSGLSAIPATYSTVCSPQRETQTVQHAAERRHEKDVTK